MLKALFLPEFIGSHRLIAQRILGITIHDDAVRLALVHARRHKSSVETLLEVSIESGAQDTHKERVAAALVTALARVKHYDQVRFALPSSLVIFKEVSLQFIDPEKIRMVLEYEIEPMLPFSIDEAVVDFIVTDTDKESQTSQVLVAAVRKQDLSEHMDMLSKANIEPAAVTVDLIAQYGLFQAITQPLKQRQTVAFVDMGMQSIRIALIHNGQLRLMRHLPRGLAGTIKQITEESGVSAEEVELKLAQLGPDGMGDEALARCTHKHFALLMNDIQFTLNSFSMKLGGNEEISKILFTGSLARVRGIVDFCSATLQMPCAPFEPQKIFNNKAIKNELPEDPSNWMAFTFALSTALVHPSQYYFDLRRKEFVSTRAGLARKQILVAGCLSFLLISIVGVKGYLDINDLSTQIDTIEKREINRLKAENIFPKEKFPKKPTLANVIRDGERIVREKLDLWAPFAKNRMNVLEIWLELTIIINKKQFDVTIKEVSISAKENGRPTIEVEGLFKSKTGDHFVDWAGLEGRFKESTLLKVIDQPDTTPAPEGGVNFSVRMHLREQP